MDELTLLRALDADTPAPSRTALECAFDALSVRMTAADERPGRHSAARRRRHSDRLRWAAVVSGDRKSTRLNSSHSGESRMPSSA